MKHKRVAREGREERWEYGEGKHISERHNKKEQRRREGLWEVRRT